MSLMTPDELAVTIKVQKSTLATWRYKKTGPVYVKLGKQIFYRRADVDTWISTQAVQPVVAEVVADARQTELAI